jgi:hypothetical protein
VLYVDRDFDKFTLEELIHLESYLSAILLTVINPKYDGEVQPLN